MAEAWRTEPPATPPIDGHTRHHQQHHHRHHHKMMTVMRRKIESRSQLEPAFLPHELGVLNGRALTGARTRGRRRSWLSLKGSDGRWRTTMLQISWGDQLQAMSFQSALTKH